MGTRLATVGSISWERGGHGAGSTSRLHKLGTKINDGLKRERDDPSRCPRSSCRCASPQSKAANSWPCCLPEQIPNSIWNFFVLSCMIPDNFSVRAGRFKAAAVVPEQPPPPSPPLSAPAPALRALWERWMCGPAEADMFQARSWEEVSLATIMKCEREKSSPGSAPFSGDSQQVWGPQEEAFQVSGMSAGAGVELLPILASGSAGTGGSGCQPCVCSEAKPEQGW